MAGATPKPSADKSRATAKSMQPFKFFWAAQHKPACLHATRADTTSGSTVGTHTEREGVNKARPTVGTTHPHLAGHPHTSRDCRVPPRWRAACGGACAGVQCSNTPFPPFQVVPKASKAAEWAGSTCSCRTTRSHHQALRVTRVTRVQDSRKRHTPERKLMLCEGEINDTNTHHNRRRLTLLLGNNSPPQDAQTAGCRNCSMPLHAVAQKNAHSAQQRNSWQQPKATNTTVTLLPRTPHYTTPHQPAATPAPTRADDTCSATEGAALLLQLRCCHALAASRSRRIGSSSLVSPAGTGREMKQGSTSA
jgi:hypothetical protein